MSSKTVRMFTVQDDKLITLAGVARSHYLKYKMFFTSFNSTIFPEDYENSVLAAVISKAQATISDAFYVGAQMKETDDMKKSRKLVERELHILSFCVQDQFRDNPVVLKEFRLHSLTSKYRSVDAFIGFTKDVLHTAEKYKADLLKSGITDEVLARIKQNSENLDMQRREQVEVMKARPRVTLDRIEKMNNLWLELVKMDKAAEIIFFDNPEIRALFELPKKVQRKSETTEEVTPEEVTA